MNILLLDNYDSFTYNLVHQIKKLKQVHLEVYRNDEILLEEVERFDKIMISPGPGLPTEAGILIPLIQHYASTKDIFGVCLGMQGMCEALGATLLNLPRVYHGVATSIHVLDHASIYANLPSTFKVGRYHSWVVDATTLSNDFKITSVDDQQHIMSVQHTHYQLQGVQFHPESILTEYGDEMILQWLNQ